MADLAAPRTLQPPGPLDPVEQSLPPDPSPEPAFSGPPPEPYEEEASADPLERARAILAAHPVADGFNGLAGALGPLAWYDLELGDSALDTDLPRLRAGGVGAQFWSLHPGEGCAVSATLEQIDRIRALARDHPERLRIALDAGDVADARARGLIASLLGPAASAALGDSIGALRALHVLGVRSLTLAGTRWTDAERGLTDFGKEVVREMNRCGMLVDLSGATDAAMRTALAVSKAPVLFTRSGARALTDHPSNVPDDVLEALGASHGLCMVSLAAEQTGPAVRDVADHLDHVRARAGGHAVGLSGAYDTGAGHAPELRDTTGYPRLIAELLDRGWTEPDLALLTWGNVQRVLRDAEFAARAAQARRRPSTARFEDLDGGA